MDKERPVVRHIDVDTRLVNLFRALFSPRREREKKKLHCVLDHCLMTCVRFICLVANKCERCSSPSIVLSGERDGVLNAIINSIVAVRRSHIGVNERKIMRIRHTTTLSTHPLPDDRTLLLNYHMPPSKLNIRLKTHSLTCLNIPLDTLDEWKSRSPWSRDDHRRTMVGSVDLISEIPRQQWEEVQDEERQPIIEHDFRGQHSSIVSHDSIARLRRNGQLRNSQQTVFHALHKMMERKNPLVVIRKIKSDALLMRDFAFSIDKGSIPKFSFRDLPSSVRASSSIQHYDKVSKLGSFPFASLPEIRSLNEQNDAQDTESIVFAPESSQPFAPSSWKKSSSWSWKSSQMSQTGIVESQRSMSGVGHPHTEYRVSDILCEILACH